jgi:hypothetical protein
MKPIDRARAALNGAWEEIESTITDVAPKDAPAIIGKLRWLVKAERGVVDVFGEEKQHEG